MIFQVISQVTRDVARVNRMEDRSLVRDVVNRMEDRSLVRDVVNICDT